MVMSFSFGIIALLAAIMGLIQQTPFPSFDILFSTTIMINLWALAILGGVVPYLLMAYSQRIISAQLAALIYILEPIFATFVAWILIDQPTSSRIIIGGALVFSALLIGVKADSTGDQKTPVADATRGA